MWKETQKLAQKLCLFELNSEPTSECFSLKLAEYPVNVNQNQSDPKNFNRNFQNMNDFDESPGSIAWIQ